MRNDPNRYVDETIRVGETLDVVEGNVFDYVNKYQKTRIDLRPIYYNRERLYELLVKTPETEKKGLMALLHWATHLILIMPQKLEIGCQSK